MSNYPDLEGTLLIQTTRSQVDLSYDNVLYILNAERALALSETLRLYPDQPNVCDQMNPDEYNSLVAQELHEESLQPFPSSLPLSMSWLV